MDIVAALKSEEKKLETRLGGIRGTMKCRLTEMDQSSSMDVPGRGTSHSIQLVAAGTAPPVGSCGAGKRLTGH